MRELTESLLEATTKRLAESIQPEKIYLFGSHAAGNANQDSDVDLLVVVPDTEESLREIAKEFLMRADDEATPWARRRRARSGGRQAGRSRICRSS